MRKTIIISEGKNDIAFLENTLSKIGCDMTKVHSYPFKTGWTAQTKRHQETAIMRSFKEITSKYSIIIKSESGRDFVEGFIKSSIFSCTDLFERVIIIMDLDGDDCKKELDKIIKEILNRKKGEKFEIKYDINKKKEINIITLNIISSTQKCVGQFFMLLFDKSLEDSASIIKSDNLPIITKKINTFSSQEWIKSIFKELFA